MHTDLDRCKEFLIANGWKFEEYSKDSDHMSYTNGNLCAVDMNNDEIVLVDGTGDFLHLPVNYFALVGALMEFRQICNSYVSTRITKKLHKRLKNS